MARQAVTVAETCRRRSVNAIDGNNVVDERMRPRGVALSGTVMGLAGDAASR